MDKLGEDEWAVDAVTSKFQVTIGRRPGFVYSTWGGLGWRFTFYDPGDPRIFTLLDTPELFIELGLTYVDRGPLNTSVTWCVFGRQIGVTSRVIPSGTTGKQSIGGSGFSAGWEAPVDAVLSLKVSFKPLLFRVTDPPQPAPPPFPARLLGTLEDAVTTGSFNDTKLYSYSCRDNDGRVHSPQALFVNSQLLREKSSYLDTRQYGFMWVDYSTDCLLLVLFGNGFSEANDEDLDGGFPQTGKKVIDDYDYGSDSDLEEMEMDVDVQSSLRSGDDGAGSGAASRDASVSQNQNGGRGTTVGRRGRVIVVKDTAYTTWNALIIYLYTGEISFTSLKSQTRVQAQQPAANRPSRSCSPKSMYRLADKVGLDDLKRSAFKAIKDNLAPSNIVHEVFCQFTSLYPDVQKLTTGYLCDNYRKPEVVRDLPVAVRRVAAGELEHAGDVIMSLMNQLASRGPV